MLFPRKYSRTYSKIHSPNYSSISKEETRLKSSRIFKFDGSDRQTTKRKYFPPRFIIYAFPHDVVSCPVLDTLNYCPGTGAPATVLRIWLSDFAYSKAAGCVASLPRKRASISVEEENYCNHYPSKERNSLLLISGSFSNLADTLELEIGFVISQEMDCSISNIYAPFETG